MDPRIQDLESRLRSASNGAALPLAQEVLAEVGLDRLPAWVLPAGTVTISDTAIAEAGSDKLNVSGSLDHPSLGPVSLALDVRAVEGRLLADLALSFSAMPSLETFLADVGVDVPKGVTDFLNPEAIHAIKVDRRTGRMALYLQLTKSQQLHLGAINLSVALTEATIALEPVALLNVAGTIRFGSQSLAVLLPAGPEPELYVSAANLTVEALLGEFGIHLPPLPPLPIVTQPLQELLIELVHGAVCIGATQRISGVGMLTVSLAKHDGHLGAVLTLLPAQGMKFSSMHGLLAPFDALLDVVSFDDPAIVLSTVTADTFPVVDAAGRWTPSVVQKGAAFYGQLRLEGFGLDVVKGLLGGVSAVPFSLPIEPDLATSRIKVALHGKTDLLPGVLSIDRFSLSLAPDPMDLSVKGIAHLSLFGEDLPKLSLGAAIVPGSYRVFLESAEPWKNPLGLPFNVEEVGLEIDGPVIAYGVYGTVALSQTTASMATNFVGNAPTFFAAEIAGELSTRILLRDLVNIDLPIPFEPTVQDASLYIVVNPLGETIGTHHFPRGIGLKGTITFLGVSAKLAAAANEHTITGRAAFNEPVRMAPLLEMTGFGGSEAPFITINSGHDPICVVSARLTVLGITQDLHAEVGADSIIFDLDAGVGPVATKLKTKVSDGEFIANGTASFGLKGSIGPLSLSAGGPSLGTLALDTAAKTTIVAAGDAQGSSSVKATVSFEVLGMKVDLPEIQLDIRSLEELPEAILDYIQRNANEIFKTLLSSADAWLKALSQGLIVGVQNVAKVLLEQFRKDVNAAADVLINSLKIGVDEVAKQMREAGQTIADIAKSLAAVNQVPNVIRNALEALGEPAQEISAALQAAFPSIPHVDFAAVPHVDVHAVPHTDVHGVHTDVGASHTDATTGHTDGTAGHTDGTGGHTDEGGGWIPHLDVGGIHTDIAGVHTDIAGVHTDIGTSHVDTEVPPHLDTPATAHIDAPATAHVDTP